jgi:hypothetical protein
MNTSNFFNLVPNFVNGVRALRSDLLGVCLVLAFAGLLIHVVHALIAKSEGPVWAALIRIMVTAILVASIQSWGDMLVGAVQTLIADMGASGTPATVFEDYQAAIARKMGTAAAAQNLSQANSGGNIQVDPTGAPSWGDAAGNGTILTHYAYPGDSKLDSGSANGQGAFPFDTAPGSLIALYSAALSPDMAAKYNVQPGQSFTITTAGGQTYNLVYADKTDASLTGRVDIYDPYNQLGGGNDFSQPIASFNGGPVVMGQTGLAGIMPNPGGSIQDQLLWAFTLALSWVASAVMWLMNILQEMLYLIEIAVSPIFIGMLMLPALTHLAKRYFMMVAGICLWPFAWAVCNLVTLVLIDLAVNPDNNLGLAVASTGALVTGPLAGLAYMIVVAVWVIGSTLGAPLFIGWMLGAAGGTATSLLFGATVGAAANTAARAAFNLGGGLRGITSFIGSYGSNGSSNGSSNGGPSSGAPSLSTRPNFATRPLASEPRS